MSVVNKILPDHLYIRLATIPDETYDRHTSAHARRKWGRDIIYALSTIGHGRVEVLLANSLSDILILV